MFGSAVNVVAMIFLVVFSGMNNCESGWVHLSRFANMAPAHVVRHCCVLVTAIELVLAPTSNIVVQGRYRWKRRITRSTVPEWARCWFGKLCHINDANVLLAV